MQVTLPEAVRSATPPDLNQQLTFGTQFKVAAGEFLCSRILLTTGASRDVELLIIDTGTVRAAICPTRGMSLWKANIQGTEIGWKSPVEGPVHPAHVAIDEGSGLGWLDGFDELLVRCGMRSFGAPDFDAAGHLKFPLHGRAGNLPARNVRIEIDEAHSLLHVIGEVHETRFLQYNLRLTAKVTLSIGEDKIAIHDVVTNAGGTPTTMQMLYHINIGAPVLEQGATAHLGAPKIVARNTRAVEGLHDWQTYLPPTPGYEEQVYFCASPADSSGWTKSLLASRNGDRGVAVHYRPESLPYFTLWKNTVANSDGYVTGLEPGTGFPNPRSFEEEKGRVVKLAAGESREFLLVIEGVLSAARIDKLKQEIASQSGGAMTTKEFDADWCVPRS